MVMTRPFFNAGSVWTTKVDEHASLNAPLWHPLLQKSGIRTLDTIGNVGSYSGVTFGKYGGSFNGTNSRFNITDHASLNPGAGVDMYIIAWVNPNADDTNYRSILWKAKTAANNQGYYLRLETTTGYAKFGVQDDNSPAEFVEAVDTTNHFGAGWLFIAGSFDRDSATGLKLFTGTTTSAVALQDSKDASAIADITNTNTLNIGIGRDDSSYSFYDTIGHIVMGKGWLPALADLERFRQRTKWRYLS